MKILSAKEFNTMSSSLSSCEEYADLEKYAAIERRWRTVERTTAFCGTVCTECPAFLATKKDDEREKTADLVSALYRFSTQISIEPETR